MIEYLGDAMSPIELFVVKQTLVYYIEEDIASTNPIDSIFSLFLVFVFVFVFLKRNIMSYHALSGTQLCILCPLFHNKTDPLFHTFFLFGAEPTV